MLERRLTFTEGVWKELSDWRNNPFYNSELVSVLEEARTRRNSRILFDENGQWGSPCGVFRNHYVNLLSERKRRAKALVDESVQKLGVRPSDNDLNRIFQQAGIERDFHIFRKGEREISADGNIFTDEELVATAAMVSLSTGRNTTIFTRDHDVLEQFYVLCGLLSSHYQGTLFAKIWANNSALFTHELVPQTAETKHYFDVENGLMVSKPVPPDDFVRWLLPSEFELICMRCILFTGQDEHLAITPLTFVCETPMLELVQAKGNSWGLNTDLLDGRNCHVTGFPLGIPDPRKRVLVVKDRTVPAQDPRFNYARLDLAHATTHFEILRTI